MVGVPKSKACRTCLQRRVKCDLTQPSCNQCTRRNLQCPGYEKRWKFLHQTTGSIQKDQRNTGVQSQTVKDALLARARQTSIDERVEPNLAAAALDLQQKEVFCTFLLTSFPAQFASCGKRVEVNWIDYARRPLLTVPQSLVWAYRALATVFIGRKYRDMNKVTCSRHMYSRALNYLAGVVRHPKFAGTEEALASGILLTMYEMVDGITGASWLTHTRGLATMIQVRGTEVHRAGFGLTLLKSCRSFLVADALIRGEHCFLGEPLWRDFLGELADIESRGPKRSELGLIVDRAFIEISSCPGWLVETHRLIDQHGHTEAKAELMSHIVRGRDQLHHLQTQLQYAIVHQRQASILAWQQFVGPIPWDFVDPFAQSSLYGMRLGISLLNQLISLLSADLQRRAYGQALWSEVETSGLQSPHPWSGLDANAQEWQVRFDPEYLRDSYQIHPSGNEDWMDRIAMSMGMLGIRA
ncbi:Zn(II)2Cys6 transcription factor domain-containing protein [Aspergillus alliaceus]|uniref:Zn(II)2Cys6 transcription factor domain-containing protein n=1 Tax=Petromyces alliaceus TaxID=209559 RepID=UPI0012A4CB71|nr:uncharacterized protein BDW43DRAFT_259752 [Aspergillus alliaceus]KAB8238767.1 hypothetical protein BDW43DRAFT_259752 [Aspergillus alliaceus]